MSPVQYKMYLSQAKMKILRPEISAATEKFKDDPLNPETLDQFLALNKCFINSLYKISLNKKESKIIDIGCGSATQLISLVSLGFDQDNLFGIDINKVDINFAKKNYPLLNLSWQDATNLDFKNKQLTDIKNLAKFQNKVYETHVKI